ncbi:hypothetical protein KC678_04940 [Candidatus Dojkabacteria bacterium]|uniref:Uncharacterized protein n=1 Tax=Candidatus Dojkabacteria bacterium TaxID=2099670 RepID=A0A955L2M1_9BACT|nr:hypothetical protein [Candidatus Dojkabacteria bacterium]
MKKRIILQLVMILGIFSSFVIKVSAQSTTDLNIDDKIGLQPISFDFFPQIGLGVDQYYTIFSWVSFVATLFSIGLVAFWIYLIVRAAFEALRSEGDAEKLQGSFEKIKSTFIGASVALIFPILLTVFGYILGLGALWSWPSALRECPSTNESAFFFQEVLRQSDAGEEDPVSAAELSCYGAITKSSPDPSK